jgi:hypothetical protein
MIAIGINVIKYLQYIQLPSHGAQLFAYTVKNVNTETHAKTDIDPAQTQTKIDPDQARTQTHPSRCLQSYSTS